MSTTIEVRFKGNRRGAFRWATDEPIPALHQPVIVEVEHGLDLAFVNAIGAAAEQKCGGCDSCGTGDAAVESERKSILRQATEADRHQHEALRIEEDTIRREIAVVVADRGLAMRISDVEWQWDRRLLTIYFTADHRVDFRTLVRQLATRYRTRIALRQIGSREEAARIGGIGRCGRELCCSTWLTEPGPVSLGLAKDQRLSLNPDQISGGCGRLLCCLKYEHHFYLEARKRFPKEGRTVHTLLGDERVVAVDILREQVVLRQGGHPSRTLPLVEYVREIREAALPSRSPEPPTPGAAQ